MLISKLIGGWINWPDMQMIFQFQVNRMKIDNFRNNFINVTHVDVLAYVDQLANIDLKN